MTCPKCGLLKVRKKGRYHLDPSRHRYQCKSINCGHVFIHRLPSYRANISDKTKIKIIELWRTDKGYIRKNDHYFKKTYTLREIATIVKVSPATVWTTIKRYPQKRSNQKVVLNPIPRIEKFK